MIRTTSVIRREREGEEKTFAVKPPACIYTLFTTTECDPFQSLLLVMLKSRALSNQPNILCALLVLVMPRPWWWWWGWRRPVWRRCFLTEYNYHHQHTKDLYEYILCPVKDSVLNRWHRMTSSRAVLPPPYNLASLSIPDAALGSWLCQPRAHHIRQQTLSAGDMEHTHANINHSTPRPHQHWGYSQDGLFQLSTWRLTRIIGEQITE